MFVYICRSITQTKEYMKIFTGLFTVLFCGLLLSTHPLQTNPQHPEAVAAYLQKYRFLSRELHQRTGIPEPVILAIAGLESAWGQSELATQANNHFGIKHKTDWSGNVYCKSTQEYVGWTPYTEQQCFRRYPLIRESYGDFGTFILNRPQYSKVHSIPTWNYRAWVEAIKDGGYATDPTYTDKVLSLIWRYRLYELVEG